MRGIAAFLIVLATAVLLLGLGETVGPHLLVYAGAIAFGLLAVALMLRGTFNAIDWGTAIITGRPPKQ